MLTGSASNRRRMVTACRVLRDQIGKFEEGFVNENGQLPRSGTEERSSIATTYCQYRVWKKAVRDDAASAIQRIVRGGLVRREVKEEYGYSYHTKGPGGRRRTSSSSSTTTSTTTTPAAAAVMEVEENDEEIVMEEDHPPHTNYYYNPSSTNTVYKMLINKKKEVGRGDPPVRVVVVVVVVVVSK